jgi:hypothetical protein
MRRIGDHAVVLGASLAGLLAARVLADTYERVTVVDRDALPSNPENRRGVLQGRHAHVLLPGGRRSLTSSFQDCSTTWPLGVLQGPRPLPVRVINAYVNWVLTAAERDRVVAERFLRVAALRDPVTRLFRLPAALRVLRGNLRRRPEPATDTTTRVAASGLRT